MVALFSPENDPLHPKNLPLGRFQYKASSSRDLRLKLLLESQRIDFILDVGANAGQFAQNVLALGYPGRILSFEPGKDAHARISVAAAGHPRWQVAPRCAIGAQAGELTLQIAGNSVSSSLLPMAEAHLTAAPESKYQAQETVPVRTLNSFLNQVPAGARLLLKSDTQGYEHHVLVGAPATLARAQGLLLEMLPGPLYEGQPDFFDLMQFVRNQGFACFGFAPDLTDERTGRMLAIDAFFFREEGH